MALPLIAFVSCSDDDDGNSSSIADGNINGTLKILGYDEDYFPVFEGTVSDEIDEIKAFVGDSYEIGSAAVSNGKFSLKLNTPPNDYMGNLGEFPEEVKISGEGARIADIYILAYKNNTEVGYVYLKNADPMKRIECGIAYVDRSLSFSGNIERTIGEDVVSSVNYNSNFSKGWNITISIKEDLVSKTTYTSSNNVPSGVEWCIER